MLKIFELIGRYFMLMGKVFSRPEKAAIYRRRIIFEMESLGVNSIGLTAIISVFIGAVITLQMCINLDSPFIPRSLVGYATRETMILEFSSAVVALILAGKVGSSIASEIGTMRITEQIDALEIMGVNSASYLILPKIVAAMVFFPFLTILSILIGILGGYLIAAATGIMIPADYVDGLLMDFKPYSITYTLIKTVFFAYMIHCALPAVHFAALLISFAAFGASAYTLPESRIRLRRYLGLDTPRCTVDIAINSLFRFRKRAIAIAI